MANQPTVWGRVRRVTGALILLCFFLPFFGISCDGMDVITVSGADMVGGCEPGGMAVELGRQGPESGVTAEIAKVPREPLAIIAMVLAVATFALAWFGTRKTLIASIATAVLGLGVLGGLHVRLIGKLDAELAEAQRKSKGAGRALTADSEIEAGGRFGLWATGLGFVVVATLSGLALRRRGADTTAT